MKIKLTEQSITFNVRLNRKNYKRNEILHLSRNMKDMHFMIEKKMAPL